MRKLVLLMIETEHPEGLSARKLVVETAKHNVLSAYNAQDGLDLLRRFSNVDVILLHSDVLSKSPNLLTQLKAHAPNVPIVLASPLGLQSRAEVSYVVDSHHPEALLRLLAEELKVPCDNG
ncbi:MAG TPA: hypothetical protein VKR52_12155 [Terracidiphilus sp.]|nr:hypothetical protein [Terracidiphilus sp.]